MEAKNETECYAVQTLMANTKLGWQPKPRDTDILSALTLMPLTTEQLFKWSERFEKPFTDIGALRRRLRRLGAGKHLSALDLSPMFSNNPICWNSQTQSLIERFRRQFRRVGQDRESAGFVRRWSMAIESDGSLPYYHKLTPAGYQFLKKQKEKDKSNQENRLPHRRRSFSAISVSQHFHTKSLCDFIVHTGVAAHRIGVDFTDLHPENTYKAVVGDESLKLDWRFCLKYQFLRRIYNVELDNSTETNLSTNDTDTIARKIRLLNADDKRFKDSRDPERAITLFACTRSYERMLNILNTAKELAANPHRSLIYGVYLPEYLTLNSPLTSPCFLNHRHEPVSLLPENVIQNTAPAIRTLSSAEAL